jgi:putative nucleotidyltransferase with HDIG domain
MQKFNLSIYILPITILPILIRSFFDSRVAIFTFVTSLLIFSFLVPNSYEFMFMQMIAGIFAIFSLQNITRRSNLFNTSIVVLVVYILTYTGISLIQENELQKIQWINFAWLALNSILIMFSYPLVFFFEKIFRFSSNLTLLELADINRPLLKQMSKIAPGTFQHSIQVANIAEELIQRIGGNALLVRAGALYHDIGKMESPEYFTENQRKGFNPHDNLTCEESAKILIGHISKGVALAKKNNLPRAIINFIEMHHGITQTRFFTAKFKAKYPDKEIDLSLFTYPGPKPISKETAAVMIADSVEAASRSLQDHSRENLKKLIDSILDYQIKENQFEFVNITFKEMTYIKSILLERLSIIYHTRIAYPEEK